MYVINNYLSILILIHSTEGYFHSVQKEQLTFKQGWNNFWKLILIGNAIITLIY